MILVLNPKSFNSALQCQIPPVSKHLAITHRALKASGYITRICTLRRDHLRESGRLECCLPQTAMIFDNINGRRYEFLLGLGAQGNLRLHESGIGVRQGLMWFGSCDVVWVMCASIFWPIG